MLSKCTAKCLDDILDFAYWCDNMATVNPHFQFWYLSWTCYDYQVAKRWGYLFVRSSQRKLIPWFFTLNHINYTRWLPVHMRDMKSLLVVCPSTNTKFRENICAQNK